MKQNGLKFSTLKMVIVGGSACPPAMIDTFRDDYGVECRHAWGMTEMSPLGTHVPRSRPSTRACRARSGTSSSASRAGRSSACR